MAERVGDRSGFQMSAIAQVRTPGTTTAEDRLLRDAFDHSPLGLALVESGLIRFANKAFAQVAGYAQASALRDLPLAELIPGDRACTRLTGPVEPIRSRELCGYPVCEFALPGRDRLVRVEASCADLEHEGRRLLIVSLRDVTLGERRHVVRDSDQRFRALFQSAAVGIAHCTLDARVQETNPALQRMLGYTTVELHGAPFASFTGAEDAASLETRFKEIASGEQDSSTFEARCIRKGGDVVCGRVSLSLVRGPDGKPEFAIAMVEDVTEAKRAQAQLQEAQKMEAIGRLVGGVAHDFNNLLTGITLYCDLLLSGLEKNSRLRHHAEEIHAAGEQGAALIQQLMAVARQHVREPRSLSLNEIIGGMRHLLSRLIGENISLECRLADDLEWVRMDPAQVQQVILNLVLNARDAMPKGGWIRITTRNLGDEVELSVRDNGCGMDQATLHRLFEPFFTTKEVGRGNGLGMATVHSIVQQSGGKIHVESAPGNGTTVLICLPRTAREASTEAVSSDVTAPGGETILLAEDNPAVRGSVARVLRRGGYQVLEAANGSEAIRLCRDHPGTLGLLIADLIMPGMGGEDVAAQIAVLRPGLPVLFISGYQPQDCQPDRPHLLIRKPFSGNALLKKVHEVFKPQHHLGLAETNRRCASRKTS